MRPKLLLLLATTLFFTALWSQNKKQKHIIGFAITASQKGQTSWKEVRLVDVTTGEEIRQVYKSNDEVEILNARTGKPVVKKEMTTPGAAVGRRKVVNLDFELDKKDNAQAFTVDAEKKLQALKLDKEKLVQLKEKTMNNVLIVNREIGNFPTQTYKPFATNSAACAYDQKHERLYYTPMGINQLRYIDLKSKTPKIYYFEDEPFGVVSGSGDARNQICRMAIAADGNGYALSNNADHLIRFTTAKTTVITDLGAVTDDGKDEKHSVHSGGNYGGDLIADAQGNLYLIGGNRSVYKISISSRVANYMGTIKGLPQGFTTNGAMVEEGSKVIVCSSQSTAGYFRFDLITLQAEKISSSENVFNASDLANGNLAFEKKKKQKKNAQPIEELPTQQADETETVQNSATPQEVLQRNSIAVYPNPVTNGFVKVSFANQPIGKYQVQLMDIAGQLISSKDVTINGAMQVEEFRLPEFVTKGSYLLKVVNDANRISVVHKLSVQ